MKLGRRQFVKTVAAAGASLAAGKPGALSADAARRGLPAAGYDVCVIGAGVFGVWTAHALQRAGSKVLLIDQYSPANSRSSSAGETRIIRMGYGSKEFYSRWSWESLAEWKNLATRSGQPLFQCTGVLWMGPARDEGLAKSAVTLGKLGIPFQKLAAGELGKRFPQIAVPADLAGLYEPESGVLLARRAVRAVAEESTRNGVEYRDARVAPPAGRGRTERIEASGGSVAAGTFVFACGPWLPRLFPELLAGRIVPTRGEEFYFGPAAGDTRFAPPEMPTWIDTSAETFGTPDVEGRGFKVGVDLHGPAFDPDKDSRTVRPESLEFARGFLARRFPGMAGAPLVENRVCQYENTSNEDFLIDRHPNHENVWLVGGGSGHGFKHGPAVGAYVAERVLRGGAVEAFFTLANKAPVEVPSIFKR